MFDCKEIILYGAWSDIAKAFKLLDKAGKKPLCIADSNSTNSGGGYGIPVVSPDKIREYSSKTIVITASYFDDIYEGLKKTLEDNFSAYEIYVAPYLWFMLINVEYDNSLLALANDFMKKHKEKLYTMYNLEDMTTKRIIDYIVRVRMQQKYLFEEYSAIAGMQYVDGYFYQGELAELDQLTIVDVGAYIGDTAEEMFGRYGDKICNYYAYEPEKTNYNILVDKVKNSSYCEKVMAFNYALGSKESELTFSKEGSCFGVLDYSEQVSSNHEIVKVVPMDDEDLSVNGTLVIKMDVEGLELEVLKGALGYIKKYRPYMAICVYHRLEDIYTIPAFILEQTGDYTFVLRSGVHTHLVAIPKKK